MAASEAVEDFVSQQRIRVALLASLVLGPVAGLVAQHSVARVLPPLPSDPSAPPASVVTFQAPESGVMTATALALDAQGNAFVTGMTDVRDLPGLGSAFQKTPNRQDVYVMKLDPSGRVLWSTYLGGNDRRSLSRYFWGDTPYAIAVDPQGQVALGGLTSSTDFPTQNAVLPQPLVASGSDGFVAKLSADGSRLVYSTYLGGADSSSIVRALAAGPAGEVWAGLNSATRQLATSHDISGGTSDNLIVKFNPAGAPIWSTRVPGQDLMALAVDGGGDSYMAACCDSPRSPFVSRVDATGTRLVYQSSLPAAASNVTGLSSISGLGIGPGGMAVAVGTSPGGLPLVDAWQSTPAGGQDAFVGILDSAGRFSTLSYVGGSNTDGTGGRVRVATGPAGFSMAFDTLSGDLPTVRPWVNGQVDGPLYTSTDRGVSWFRTREGSLPQPIEDLAIEGPANILHAATLAGLYLSSDNGETWTQERAGRHTIVSINPRNPRERYISDGFVVSRHERGASQGTLLLTALPGANISVVAVNPLDDSLWVSGNFGLDASFDGGRTWVSRRAGLPNSTVPAGRSLSPGTIAFDPRRPEVVYLGFSTGLYASEDNGGSWRNLTAGLSESVGVPISVSAIVVDARDSGTICAGARGRGVYVTHDAGRTWSITLTGSIIALAADPADSKRLYASVEASEGTPFIWRSVDGGTTWQSSSGAWQMRRAPSRLQIHPLDPVRVFAASGYYDYVPYVTQFATAPAASSVVRPILATANAVAAYRNVLATYLTTGTLKDVAMSPTGELVVLIELADGFSKSPAAFAIVRIGR